MPKLHQALEVARRQILARVAGLMLSSSEPWAQLGGAVDIANEILGRDFEPLYGSLVRAVASGEIARLIGECTIGWKKPVVIHG